MAQSKMAPAKTASRIRGFLIGYGFTPGGFSTRVNPPYFQTSHHGLAEAVSKAKGTTELTPVQMEEYETARLVLDPNRMRKKLQQAVLADEGAHQEAQAKAARDAAVARTKAQAAEQRAAAAADRVAELEAAKKKAQTTKTGEIPTDDADLFDDVSEASSLTLSDLNAMDNEEIAGVLALYDVPVPSPPTRAVILRVAQLLVTGKIRKSSDKGDSSA